MVKVDDIPASVPEMATLTPEKEALIEAFLSKLNDRYKEKVPFYVSRESTEEKRRIFAYKVLTARRWKMKQALEMVEKTVAFRTKHNIDDWKLFPCAFPLKGYDESAICAMLKTMPGCEGLFPREGESEIDKCYRALQASYVNMYHYWDKEGHPVLYDCCGRADIDQILHDLAYITSSGRSLGDVIVPYHTYMNEVQYYLIEYADQASKKAGKRPIMGITVVMDMEGLSFKVVRRSFIQVIRAIFEVDQSYYPEALHRLFVINAPRFFRMAYDLVKGSLDENTRRKLVFSSDKTEALEILKRIIDEDKIPQELGGACHCMGGCLPRYVKPIAFAATDESITADSAASNAEVQREEIYLKAGKEWTHAYTLMANEEVTWALTVSKEAEVVFTAAFEPDSAVTSKDGTIIMENSVTSKKSLSTAKSVGKTKSEAEVLKHEKLSTDVDTLKVSHAGTLTLTLSNKHSWMHGKHIDLHITRTPALGAQRST